VKEKRYFVLVNINSYALMLRLNNNTSYTKILFFLRRKSVSQKKMHFFCEMQNNDIC